MWAQRVAARQHGEVLQHDGVEQRRHQLIGRDALLLQAVDVGFGEDAALAGHRMQLDSGVALVAKLRGGNLQLGIDLVDDRARAAGALVVHRRNLLLAAGVLVLLEDDDLRVLPAQLDDRVHLGMQLLHGQRNRGDFLHELGADQVGQRAAARAGDEDAAVVRSNADFLLHALEELQQLLRLLGLMALVVLPDHLVGLGVDHHRLDGRRANVHADGVDRLEAGLRVDFARTGQDPCGKRLFDGRGVQQSVQLDVNLLLAACCRNRDGEDVNPLTSPEKSQARCYAIAEVAVNVPEPMLGLSQQPLITRRSL